MKDLYDMGDTPVAIPAALFLEKTETAADIEPSKHQRPQLIVGRRTQCCKKDFRLG
jgi:hypothetical protein